MRRETPGSIAWGPGAKRGRGCELHLGASMRRINAGLA